MSLPFVGVTALVPGADIVDEIGPDTTVLVSSTRNTLDCYEVRFFAHDGAWELSCTCQSWKYQKREIWDRECKHTRHVRHQLNEIDRASAKGFWYFGRASDAPVASVLVSTFQLPDDVPDWAR